MRALSLACLLLSLAAPAMAEDRYGPQSAAQSAPISYAPVTRLSWPGKVEPAAVEAKADEPIRPLADGVLRRTSVYGAAPAPVLRAPSPPAVVANAGPPPAENAPWRRLTGVSAAPRPTAAPAAMEEAAAKPPVASAGLPPAAQRAPTGEQARYYSLHREYGETPDSIPAPEKSQVFLAGGPLASGVGDGDEAIDSESTGRTAAINKARLAADWGSSSGK
jgi:hypothetical protein